MSDELCQLMAGQRVLSWGTLREEDVQHVAASMTTLREHLDNICASWLSSSDDHHLPSSPQNLLRNTIIPYHMLKLTSTSSSSRDLVDALRRIKGKARELSSGESSGKSTQRKRVESGVALRVGKMRDIKSEIGNLMSKIDQTSKSIQESLKTPSTTVGVTVLQDVTTITNIPPPVITNFNQMKEP